MQKYGREPISLHTPLGGDGDSEFGDLIQDSGPSCPPMPSTVTLLQEQLQGFGDPEQTGAGSSDALWSDRRPTEDAG